MLDDQPRREDDAPPEPPPPASMNTPLVVTGVAGAAFVLGLLAVSGFLTPVLIFGGAIVAFVAVQAVIFKLFPPGK